MQMTARLMLGFTKGRKRMKGLKATTYVVSGSRDRSNWLPVARRRPGSRSSVAILEALGFDPIVEMVKQYKRIDKEIEICEEQRAGKRLDADGKPERHSKMHHVSLLTLQQKTTESLLRFKYGRVPEVSDTPVEPQPLIINLNDGVYEPQEKTDDEEYDDDEEDDGIEGVDPMEIERAKLDDTYLAGLVSGEVPEGSPESIQRAVAMDLNAEMNERNAARAEAERRAAVIRARKFNLRRSYEERQQQVNAGVRKAPSIDDEITDVYSIGDHLNDPE